VQDAKYSLWQIDQLHHSVASFQVVLCYVVKRGYAFTPSLEDSHQRIKEKPSSSNRRMQPISQHREIMFHRKGNRIVPHGTKVYLILSAYPNISGMLCNRCCKSSRYVADAQMSMANNRRLWLRSQAPANKVQFHAHTVHVQTQDIT
jgi:hypothetical protein